MVPTWSFQCGVPTSGATGPVVPPWALRGVPKTLIGIFPRPLLCAVPCGPYVVFPMPSMWCPPGRLRGLSHAPGPSVVSPKPLRGISDGPYVVSPVALTWNFSMAPTWCPLWPLRGTFPWPLRGVVCGAPLGPAWCPVLSHGPPRGVPCDLIRGVSSGPYVVPHWPCVVSPRPLRGTFPWHYVVAPTLFSLWPPRGGPYVVFPMAPTQCPPGLRIDPYHGGDPYMVFPMAITWCRPGPAWCPQNPDIRGIFPWFPCGVPCDPYVPLRGAPSALPGIPKTLT